MSIEALGQPANDHRQKMPYLVLAVLAGTVFIAITTEVLPVGLLPVISRDLGTSDSQTGLLVSAYALVVALASIPLTALIVRWPRRRVLIGLLLLYALSNVLTAAAGNYWIALGARLLGGLAHAGFFSAVFAAAVAVSPTARSGRATAIVASGTGLGLAAGVPLGTAFGTAVGWRWAFLACAGVMLLLAGATAKVMPADAAPAATGAGTPILTAIRGRALVMVAVMIVVLTLGHYTAYTYVSPMLLRDGVGVGTISVVLAGYGVAGIAGLVLTGTVVDRRPRGALYAAIVLTVACLLAVGLIHNPLGATVVVAAWGFAFGMLPTLIQAVALRAVPNSPDAAPAVVNSAFNVGIAGGALIGARELLVATPSTLALTGAALAAASLVALAAVPRPSAASRPTHADDPTEAGRPAAGVTTSR